jgi:hypothetical protein
MTTLSGGVTGAGQGPLTWVVWPLGTPEAFSEWEEWPAGISF